MRLPVAIRYAQALVGPGVERGLIGPREAPRIWERHILNSAVVEELVPYGAHVADIGTGAGLPGIPLAIARPDLTVTLIEPLLRRTRFLNEIVAELELDDRVTVVRARAEEMQGKAHYDCVTSRAVAPLGKLARWSVPLVKPGGAVLAMKGSSAADEVQRDQAVLRKLGVQEIVVRSVGSGTLEQEAVVVVLRMPE